MSYSHFILRKTDHISGQKFYTCSGAFVKPLPSRDIEDYFIQPSPKHEAHDHETKRLRLETTEMVALLQWSKNNDYFSPDAQLSSVNPFVSWTKVPSRFLLNLLANTSWEDHSHDKFNNGCIKAPQFFLPRYSSLFYLTGHLRHFQAMMNLLAHSGMLNFKNYFFTPDSFYFDHYPPSPWHDDPS